MQQAVATTGYRGPNVCKIVGISYRQLDYWARTGLATPSVQPAMGSGSQRLYSFEDLIELKLIKKLLDTGVSLQRVREAIDYLRTLDLMGASKFEQFRKVVARRIIYQRGRPKGLANSPVSNNQRPFGVECSSVFLGRKYF